MVHARDVRYSVPLILQQTCLRPSLLHPVGILLLSPLIIVVSAAILLGLLGIFVAWLLVVTALVSAIVISDLARRSMSYFAPPSGELRHRAVGYPGH